MTDEIKKETTPETPEEETPVDAEVPESTEEEGEAEDLDNKIDYKAEAEKEKLAREDAEGKLALTRQKAQERIDAKKRSEEGFDDDAPQPISREEFETRLTEAENRGANKAQEAQAVTLASAMSTSDDERDRIVDIFNNRTFPSYLSLNDKMEECYAIANRKKLVGERDEALRALKGKEGATKHTASAHHDPQKGPSNHPKLAPVDAKAMEQKGLKLNEKTGYYEKTLPNGDVMVANPSTGENMIVPKQ